jgi:hypothetical protein
LSTLEKFEMFFITSLWPFASPHEVCVSITVAIVLIMNRFRSCH